MSFEVNVIETLGHHDVDWKLRSGCKVSGAFCAIYEHEKSDLDVERILLLCSFLEQFCKLIHVLFDFFSSSRNSCEISGDWSVFDTPLCVDGM